MSDGESNAGAMFRHQTEPRGGAQPEGSDDDPRGAGDPRPAHHKKSMTEVIDFLCGWQNNKVFRYCDR